MDELPNRAGATLGTTDPPRHDRLRALIQHAFMKRNLETLDEPIRRIGIEAAEAIEGATTSISSLTSPAVTPRILFLLLGLPPQRSRSAGQGGPHGSVGPGVARRKGPEHIAAYEWMMSYASDVIAERRARPART